MLQKCDTTAIKLRSCNMREERDRPPVQRWWTCLRRPLKPVIITMRTVWPIWIQHSYDTGTVKAVSNTRNTVEITNVIFFYRNHLLRNTRPNKTWCVIQDWGFQLPTNKNQTLSHSLTHSLRRLFMRMHQGRHFDIFLCVFYCLGVQPKTKAAKLIHVLYMQCCKYISM